jgi:hypothetical protein
MDRRLAFRQLLDVAEVEAWIGEGKPGQCFVEIDGQAVAVVVCEDNFDPEPAQSFQIAIEAANVDPELAEDLRPGQGAIAKERE